MIYICQFKDAFGHWSGIVGELVRHEADIGVASLTISSVRQKAVDFSTPFMNLGISIMVYKQKQAVIISVLYKTINFCIKLGMLIFEKCKVIYRFISYYINLYLLQVLIK